jgi:hypothetical protein
MVALARLLLYRGLNRRLLRGCRRHRLRPVGADWYNRKRWRRHRHGRGFEARRRGGAHLAREFENVRRRGLGRNAFGGTGLVDELGEPGGQRDIGAERGGLCGFARAGREAVKLPLDSRGSHRTVLLTSSGPRLFARLGRPTGALDMGVFAKPFIIYSP